MAVTCKGSVCGRITVESGRKSAVRSFLFLSSEGESPADLFRHNNFPKEGDSFPELPELKCSKIEISPKRSGNQTLSTVRCEYTEPDYGGSADSKDLPIGKAFHVSVSSAETVVPFQFSYDETDSEGNPTRPVVSSAGTEIQANTVQMSVILGFSYYLRYFNPDWIQEYADTVNAGPLRVCGMAVGTEKGLIRSLSAKSLENSDDVLIEARLELNPHGFLRRFPDKSVCFIQEGQQQRIQYAVRNSTSNGRYSFGGAWFSSEPDVRWSAPVDYEMWLNGQGALKTDQYGSKLSPEILSFREKRRCSWGVLKFPERGV